MMLREGGRRAGLAILAGGVVLRVAELFNGRPLWLDEAWLALNVLSRPLTGLFYPLDNQQMSPLGFLWGEWLVTRVAGASELALRAIPFVAGVAALVLFARLARRLLDPGPALVAMALVALSPLLIFYSAETKSYELDALLTIGLMLATLDVSEHAASRGSLIRWAVVAALGALLSTPAPLIVGGCALALLFLPQVRSLMGVSRLALASAPATLLFAFQLLTVYHSSATLSSMERYWGDAFLEPRFPQIITDAVVSAKVLFDSVVFGANPLSGDPVIILPPRTLALLLGISLVGAIGLYRRSRFSVGLVFAPVALAAVAAVLQRWPLTPRLLLFAVPAVVLTVAAGLGLLSQLAPARVRTPAFAVISLGLLSVVAVGTGSALRHPPAVIPTPTAMAEIGRRHTPGATVYVEGFQVPSCRYYSVWHPDRARGNGDPREDDCAVGGARTLLGIWPPNRTRGEAALVQWAQSESSRILASGSNELWLIGREQRGMEDLAKALVESGAELVQVEEFGRVRLAQYRPRISGAGQVR